MALVLHHRSPGDELGHRFTGAALRGANERFAVYEAREAATDRAVFVKIPKHPDQRWLRESLDSQAAILGALSSHPNIITLYQRLSIPDGRPALVLEHSPSRLSDLLVRDGRETARTVAALGIKLAGALDAVHRNGILHCDVRPHNVLRSEWGEPVLAGFDEAVHVYPGVSSYAVLATTTPHTAPEALLGEDVTPRTDVYGLAATLYELLAGRSAFRAYAGEAASSIVVRVLDGRVKQIVLPDVPLAMSDLLTWAMSPTPADRPPSPAWLAEELARIEGDEGWPRTPLVA